MKRFCNIPASTMHNAVRCFSRNAATTLEKAWFKCSGCSGKLLRSEVGVLVRACRKCQVLSKTIFIPEKWLGPADRFGICRTSACALLVFWHFFQISFCRPAVGGNGLSGQQMTTTAVNSAQLPSSNLHEERASSLQDNMREVAS